jgi:hypothetical protein
LVCGTPSTDLSRSPRPPRPKAAQHGPWQGFYLDYKGLKKFLSVVSFIRGKVILGDRADATDFDKVANHKVLIKMKKLLAYPLFALIMEELAAMKEASKDSDAASQSSDSDGQGAEGKGGGAEGAAAAIVYDLPLLEEYFWFKLDGELEKINRFFEEEEARLYHLAKNLAKAGTAQAAASKDAAAARRMSLLSGDTEDAAVAAKAGPAATTGGGEGGGGETKRKESLLAQGPPLNLKRLVVDGETEGDGETLSMVSSVSTGGEAREDREGGGVGEGGDGGGRGDRGDREDSKGDDGAATAAADPRRDSGTDGEDDHDPEAAKADRDARRDLMKRTVDFNASCSKLNSFVELNYTAFFKIVKKHDKLMKTNTLASYMARVDQQPFYLKGITSTMERWRDSINSLSILEKNGNAHIAELKTALQWTRGAFRDLHPDFTKEERQDFNDMLASTTSDALQNLESELEGAKGSQSASEALLNAKNKVFHTFMRAVVAQVQDCDPEAAAAMEKLNLAHSALFGCV